MSSFGDFSDTYAAAVIHLHHFNQKMLTVFIADGSQNALAFPDFPGGLLRFGVNIHQRTFLPVTASK